MQSTLTRTFLDYVRPHSQRLYAAARQYAAQADDANDLVQETLLRAWRGFTPNDERTYSRAWLFVILRNVAFEWQRKAKHRIRLVSTPDAELTEISPPDQSEPFCPLPAMDEERFREFLDERLVAALDALEPAFREVIILSVASGLNYREIAEVIGCPVGTVMSRMARARRALRERLGELAQSQRWVREGRS